jgi:NTE family protein
MKIETTVFRRDSEGNSETGLLSSNSQSGPPKVGLALSSGGARGLAHIGVLQVLEENGIPIHAIAGSSMGAYVAAVWAYGHDGQQMEKLAREVEGRWSWLRLLDPVLVPRSGLLHGDKTRRRLHHAIGDVSFSDLVRPLRVVATNLVTLERKVFSSGEVALAVQASSAIPGICEPVRIGDETFFDGGVADPLPVEVARAMGVDCVIAVNVIPTPAYLRCRLEFEHEQALLRKQRENPLTKLIRRAVAARAAHSIWDVMRRSMLAGQMQMAELSCRHADVILRPLSFDGHWHDFHRPGKYIELGRRTAEEHLPEIRELIRRHTHEHPAPQHPLAAAA